jgi:hypothetical protein
MRLPPPNMPEAVRWYRRSSEQNWSGGEYHLGLCYLSGSGVEQDQERGLNLIRKAADEGHLDSVLELANLYAKGIGEPRSEHERPLQLLLRIAGRDRRDDGSREGNIPFADIVLRYEYGIGTQRDIVAAVEWYCRAATDGVDQFSFDNQTELGQPKPRPRADYGRDAQRGIVLVSPPADWRRGDRFPTVLSLYLKAAKGNAAAMMQIGNLYLMGKDVPRNSAKAWIWFTLASQNGAAGSQTKISEAAAHMASAEMTEAAQLFPGLIEELRQTSMAVQNNHEQSESK